MSPLTQELMRSLELRAAERSSWQQKAQRYEAQLALAQQHKARGLTPEMIADHYPISRHQVDECEMCDAIHKIAAAAIGGER